MSGSRRLWCSRCRCCCSCRSPMPSRSPPGRAGCVSCRSSAGEPSGGGWRCSSTSCCSAARCSCAGAPAPGRKYDSEAHAPAPPLMLVTLKTLLHTVLLPPGGPLLVAGAGAWLARSGVTARARRAGWLLLAASLVVSWLLATPVVADWLERAAERSPPLDLTRPVAAQALVILGGGDEGVAAPEYGGAPAPRPPLSTARGARATGSSGTWCGACSPRSTCAGTSHGRRRADDRVSIAAPARMRRAAAGADGGWRRGVRCPGPRLE